MDRRKERGDRRIQRPQGVIAGGAPERLAAQALRRRGSGHEAVYRFQRIGGAIGAEQHIGMDVIGKRACPLVVERLDGRGHVRRRQRQCACRLGGKVILEPIMAIRVDAHRLLDQSAGAGKVAGDRVLAVDESLWRRGLAPQVGGRLHHVADEIGARPQRHQRRLVVDRVAERHGLGEKIAEAGEQVHPGEYPAAGRGRRRAAVEGQPAVLRADECRLVIVDAHGRGDGGAVHGVEARRRRPSPGAAALPRWCRW